MKRHTLGLASSNINSSTDQWWQYPVNISKNNTDNHPSQRSDPVISQCHPLHSWPMRLCHNYRVSSANWGNNDSLKEIKRLSVLALTVTHFMLLLYFNLHLFISVIRSRSLFLCLPGRDPCVSTCTCAILYHIKANVAFNPKTQFQMTDL